MACEAGPEATLEREAGGEALAAPQRERCFLFSGSHAGSATSAWVVVRSGQQVVSL